MRNTDWQHRNESNLVPGFYVMSLETGPSWLKGPFDSKEEAKTQEEENCIVVVVSKE